MKNKISFFVRGIPKPQARPRVYRVGKFIKTHSPKTDFFNICYYEGLNNRPKMPLTGSLNVRLCFYMPKPQNIKKGVFWHIKRPDLDNMAKAVMDALTNAGFWPDDSVISELNLIKVYSDIPGVKINVYEKET